MDNTQSGKMDNTSSREIYNISARETDNISAEGIRRFLRGGSEKYRERIRVYPVLASTNITAKELAAAGAEHGTVILADRQTKGRGRLEHSFFSPAGGLYMSLILEPAAFAFRDVTIITAMAATAVCGTVEEITGRSPEIKWVNDLLLDGKKICGILAEGIIDPKSGGLSSVVLGIGVNARIRQEDFPEELRDIAVSLDPKGIIPDIRNRLAAGIMNRILTDNPPNQKEILDCYRRRLGMLGKTVVVLRPGCEPVPAVAEELDESGALIVRFEDDRREILSSGEIHLRTIKG